MAAFQTGTTDFGESVPTAFGESVPTAFGESVPTALVSRLRMILDKTFANFTFLKHVQN